LTSANAVGAAAQGTPIFGSVSTADIAQEIKNSVAHNEEAASIILDAENIRVVSRLGEDADGTRLKALGLYNVEITLGDGLLLKRMVEVRPERKGVRMETGNRTPEVGVDAST
jgi:ribosomal protein L9